MAHHVGAGTDTLPDVTTPDVAEQSADEQNAERASAQRPRTPASNRVAPLALLVAIAATALAVWGLLRPTATQEAASSAASDTSAEHIANSKAEACTAFQTVRSAVSIQTHAGSDGPAGAQAVAANARLSMLGGAAYLLARMGPSTPPELTDAIHQFANGLQDIAMHSLTGIGNDDPRQAERLRDTDTANKSVADICAQP